MKNAILYFTGTGNSLEVATYLEDNLNDSEAHHILKFDEEEVLGECDTIGFVFPCYFTSVPDIIIAKISEMPLPKNAYYYAIVTYNGFLGNTITQLAGILEGKECTLSYNKGIKMPGNYIIEYSGMETDKAGKKLQNARSLYLEVVESIQARSIVKAKSSFALFSVLFYKFFTRKKSAWGMRFSVNDNCVGCGLCKGVCSLNNIEMSNNKPCWSNKCEHCVACIQWCPYNAIEYGKKTAARRRYTNPTITITDMM